MSVNPAEPVSAAPKGGASSAGVRRYLDVPGPRGLPLLGNAHQIKPESFHRKLEGWTQQFGSAFRFRISRRNFLGISDPAVIASVLKQRPEVFYRGPRLVQVSRDLGFHGVFSANGEAWRRQRQIVMAGLDPAHLKAFLPSIAEVTGKLRARWIASGREDHAIDLLADLMRYTVDVTTCLAFGRNLNTLEQGDLDVIQQHLNVIFPAVSRRTFAPVDIEHWLPRPALRRHAAALQKAVQGFIREARQQLERKPELAQRPENLLQALVAACDSEGDRARLGDEELSGNVLTMLLAGEDTTANTLGWLIWLLHNHPAEWERARSEVDAVVGAGSIPQSTEQLSRLDFVEACANEAMRLKPVAPLNILHAVQDVVVGDVAVPRGTFVACIMRPAGMDAGRFDDPQAFRPSRWMKGGHAEGEGMMGAKRVVMPFGGGPRVCPGRYLALAEIKMVMAMLLANFDVARMEAPEGGPAERLSLTMSPVGLALRLAPRRA
jgi:cytochrome P450